MNEPRDEQIETASSLESEAAAQFVPVAGPDAPTGSANAPEGDALTDAVQDAQAAAGATPPTAEATEGAPEAKADASDKPRRKPKFPMLVRAYRNGTPVRGTIQAVIKGGYEVRVGRARGFCPHSQIESHREENPESHVSQTYDFRITQLRRGGEDLVLSRRALLEEQRAEEAKAVRATLIEGHVMQGRVAGTASFGAFIDLGAGVMGLAHVSELAHRRVLKVEDAVRVGDVVQVKVLKIHGDTGKVSLSLRAAQRDPWEGAAETFVVGRSYPGRVVRLADFGAFVELAPGVEALAPASEMPPAPGGWREGLEVGTARDWQVLSVDAAERRISLTFPSHAADEPLSEGATVTGRVQRIERYGVFVWLGPGRVGLMPKPLTGTPPGTDLARAFGIGDSIEVTVLEITDGGRKIRLARSGVVVEDTEPQELAPAPSRRESRRRDSHRREPREMPEREPPPPRQTPETFGTSLADKLRAALDGRED